MPSRLHRPLAGLVLLVAVAGSGASAQAPGEELRYRFDVRQPVRFETTSEGTMTAEMESGPAGRAAVGVTTRFRGVTLQETVAVDGDVARIEMTRPDFELVMSASTEIPGEGAKRVTARMSNEAVDLSLEGRKVPIPPEALDGVKRSARTPVALEIDDRGRVVRASPSSVQAAGDMLGRMTGRVAATVRRTNPPLPKGSARIGERWRGELDLSAFDLPVVVDLDYRLAGERVTPDGLECSVIEVEGRGVRVSEQTRRALAAVGLEGVDGRITVRRSSARIDGEILFSSQQGTLVESSLELDVTVALTISVSDGGERESMSTTMTLEASERTKCLLPVLTIDRTAVHPGSLIRASGSGFRSGEELTVFWDGVELVAPQRVPPKIVRGEVEERIDFDRGYHLVRRGEGTVDNTRGELPARSWITVPPYAVAGVHELTFEFEKSGRYTREVEVMRQSQADVNENVQRVMELYLDKIPRNKRYFEAVNEQASTWTGSLQLVLQLASTLGGCHGAVYNFWYVTAQNVRHPIQPPKFVDNWVCGGYQRQVLDFLEHLKFNEDPDVRALMDGIDFGPLGVGLDPSSWVSSTTAHHTAVIWPARNGLPESGEAASLVGAVVLDPWINQAPTIYPMKEYAKRYTKLGFTGKKTLIGPDPEYRGRYPLTGARDYVDPFAQAALRSHDERPSARRLPRQHIVDCPVSVTLVDSAGNRFGFEPDGSWSGDALEGVTYFTTPVETGTATYLAWSDPSYSVELGATGDGECAVYALEPSGALAHASTAVRRQDRARLHWNAGERHPQLVGFEGAAAAWVVSEPHAARGTPAGDAGGDPASSPLVADGGFEAALEQSWGTGAHQKSRAWWTSRGAAAEASRVRGEAHSGQWSLRIVNRSPRAPHVYGTISQRIAVEPGATYRVVFWAKALGAGAGTLHVIVDETWTERVSIDTGTYDWRRYEKTLVAARSGYVDLRILSENVGVAWIDDIEMHRVTEDR